MNTLPHPRGAALRDGEACPDSDLILGRYRMTKPLGSGGHATVWVARDEKLRRNVAIKRIPRAYGADGNDRHRIEREALANARLSHPAIVGFYEAASDDRAYYLVSELVNGPSLAELYASARINDRELMRIGVALAAALQHAHARGVVHRDVKPQNIIVAADPIETGAPAKLTDFGVAHVADERPLTHVGDVIGTLAYMAPEQADGQTATPASDLYALALTLYEGFAGQNPLRGATAAATARRLGNAIPSLARARPDLPVALSAAVDRALAPDPDRRGTLNDLRGALTDAHQHRHRRLPRPNALRNASFATPSLTPRAQRLISGASAAVLSTVALATVLGPHSDTTIFVIAAAALIVVSLAANAGWLALAFGAVAWLALAGQPGTAIVLFVALAPVPVLLATTPWLWSAAGLAPLLGALGVAAAFPGFAAKLGGGSTWRRGVLGMIGYWWVAITEELTGHHLLFGLASGARDRTSWAGSVSGAFNHALLPLVGEGRLAAAALWATAAVVLPWILRSERTSWRMVAALAWAGGLILASAELAAHIGAATPPLPFVAVPVAAAIALTVHRVRLRAPGRARVA